MNRPDTRSYPHPNRIHAGIWWVGRGAWRGDDPVLSKPGDCNIYLIRGGEFDVLVDGGGPGAPLRLMKNVRLAGSDPARVRELWITHSHSDHILGAADWVRRFPHTRCRVPELGHAYIRRGDFRLFGYPSGAMGRRPVLPKRLTPYAPGEILRCPPYRFRAESLPGHIPDLCGFRGRVGGLEVLFSSDAVIGDQGAAKGCVGWLDGYWLSNLREYQKTLSNLQQRVPDLFLPGHGRSHYGASAKRSIGHCLDRLRRMAAIPHLNTMVPFA